jgi:hypothetical protein
VDRTASLSVGEAKNIAPIGNSALFNDDFGIDIKNWNGFGTKGRRHNRGTIPAFAWRS